MASTFTIYPRRLQMICYVCFGIISTRKFFSEQIMIIRTIIIIRVYTQCISLCVIIGIYRTHELPKFHYWCWGTMTGITGILLTVVTGSIFICSLPIVRKASYNWFSFVHSLYPVFYILMVLHGSGRLVQVINVSIYNIIVLNYIR